MFVPTPSAIVGCWIYTVAGELKFEAILPNPPVVNMVAPKPVHIIPFDEYAIVFVPEPFATPEEVVEFKIDEIVETSSENEDEKKN